MKFRISNDFGRVELGVGGGVGYHMKNFFIETGLQTELTNIHNNADIDKRNIRNRMIRLQLGYCLK